MGESELVRCLDCGHEWECSAQYPQCSDPDDECGRSRNVEPVSELERDASARTADTGSPSERDGEPSGDSHAQPERDSEWSPLFDAQETETEPVEDMSMSEPPEIDDYGGADEPDGMGRETPEETAEATAEQIPELEAEDIELFVKTPFDMAATTRGDHWELGDDELDQLSHAYARVGNKYAPYLLKEHAPEAMAAVTTMAVVGPRMAEDKRQQEEQESEERDDEAQEQADRSSGQQVEQIETDNDAFAYDQL